MVKELRTYILSAVGLKPNKITRALKTSLTISGGADRDLGINYALILVLEFREKCLWIKVSEKVRIFLAGKTPY